MNDAVCGPRTNTHSKRCVSKARHTNGNEAARHYISNSRQANLHGGLTEQSKNREIVNCMLENQKSVAFTLAQNRKKTVKLYRKRQRSRRSGYSAELFGRCNQYRNCLRHRGCHTLLWQLCEPFTLCGRSPGAGDKTHSLCTNSGPILAPNERQTAAIIVGAR